LRFNEIKFSPSYLASLGPYTDVASESLLIDESISEYIASQLVFSRNAIDLNAVDIFPVGTTFQAIDAIDGGVEYADVVDAVLSSVPEPESVAIFAAGLFLLSGFRCRKKLGA
jgi:hypothetical protein